MSTDMKLYEVAEALLRVEDALVEAGGELTPETEAALDALEGALEEKVDGICAVAATLARRAEAAKAEADRLAALARTRENAARALKDYLHRNLTLVGRDRVETDRWKVGIYRNSRPSIAWPGDVADLPDGLRRVTVALDGTAAYEAWKANALPAGFEVVQGSHIRIR